MLNSIFDFDYFLLNFTILLEPKHKFISVGFFILVFFVVVVLF